MPSTNLLFIPPYIAHRGASALAPENTLAAFRKVKDLGIKWVEFDVMLTSQNEIVVIHDETLERTTNGKGHVRNYSYTQLMKLDAGKWFSKEFSHQRIPTLYQVLNLVAELKLNANIEIKAFPGSEDAIVTELFEVLKLFHKKKISILISSFSIPTLQYVRKQSPSAVIGFLMHEWIDDWQNYCDQLQCVSVGTNKDILDPMKVKEIKDTDRFSLAYTVNHSQEAEELFSWGVDAIFTDCPPRVFL